MTTNRRGLLLLVTALLLAAPATCSTMTFSLVWSGAEFENSATATGLLVVDEASFTTWMASSSSYIAVPASDPGLLDFTITISGASVGNGTFTLSDFSTLAFWGAGATFDYSQDLVGQDTNLNTWGTPGGGSGDFNAFAISGSDAPLGSGAFTLETNNHSGDQLLLTSFTQVPEPGTFGLLGTGLLALLVGRRLFAKAPR